MKSSTLNSNPKSVAMIGKSILISISYSLLIFTIATTTTTTCFALSSSKPPIAPMSTGRSKSSFQSATTTTTTSSSSVTLSQPSNPQHYIRTNHRKYNAVVATAVSTTVTVAACFALAMPPAFAATTTTNDISTTTAPVTVFNHEYADPFHPLCKRRIQVNTDDMTFHYSGTAVGPKDDPVQQRRGCSAEEIQKYGLRQGAFDGHVVVIVMSSSSSSTNTNNGRIMKISAGDGVHEGVWEAANSVNTNNLC
eukprot:CAMPEP_0196810216 /NCGR_PEP_ID=MMETSP1362-20130617/10031_1 /TAXON_ID=163516 /ORGANISM="Leptocylindrus danicus, Strain CCMP1856" /LENGTH=250 /DNA_ID=CAMNT_0042185115 /DNA_START=183 /DNA_END=935 /DNA_ORIENTATION=-